MPASALEHLFLHGFDKEQEPVSSPHLDTEIKVHSMSDLGKL